ncbi:MAG: molybdopterin-dependent oxidoreductase [Nitrospinae bacterium]|nr:molybdopterin-dependent oxidoreductase [Nitrospinota bacterium]
MEFKFRRRDFLKGLLSGGAVALGGCSPEKTEKVIPYVVPPDDYIPGVSKWYNSVCRECPAGCGAMVRQREGRVLKVEGNPKNPVNEGALCVRGQASLQGLYNPDRFAQPYARNQAGKMEKISWEDGINMLAQKIKQLSTEGKIGNAMFLSGHVTGARAKLIDTCSSLLGMKKRATYEAFSYESIKTAGDLCFGRKEVPFFVLEKADYLLNFGADLFETWISPVRYSKDFSRMRQNDGYYKKSVHVEPRHSLTAAGADEWVSIRPGTEVFMALGIGHELLKNGKAKLSAEESAGLNELLAAYTPEKVAADTDVPAPTIKRIAKELGEAESGLVLGPGMAGGGKNSVDTWVAVYLLNHILGGINQTILFGLGESIGQTDSYGDIQELTARMKRQEVPLLMVHETNPAYSMPGSAEFKKAIDQVPFVVSFSTFPDETTEFADLILPDHTWMERWDDFESRKGAHGLLQPVMDPVTDTRNFGDVLIEVCLKILGGPNEKLSSKTYYDYLLESWKGIHAASGETKSFDGFWEGALRRGGYFAAAQPENASFTKEIVSYKFMDAGLKGSANEFYFYVYPSGRYFDGRSADRQWLQEIPDPITVAVWDSWAEIHPQTAAKLGVKRGDVLKVRAGKSEIKVPAYIYEGVRPDMVAVQAGQGHEALGRYAMNVGVNAVSILPQDKEPKSGALPWLSTLVSLEKTGEKHLLVTLDGSLDDDNRGIYQTVTKAELEHGGDHGKGHHAEKDYQMYAPHEHPTYQWAMAVDLNKCIGCGACSAACYAENNLPVVGKKECGVGREMAWIRIERYFTKKDGTFRAGFVPMMCQQCHNAPCESVCPAYATYHNNEGLNVQVYNRCVGTRYCSNNCPYKVRRFNWYTYKWDNPLEQQLNPDISVRQMGIMEKCTFCVQRIREGKDRAKDEGRLAGEGDIQPACAQTCPVNAITFGNLKDPKSEVFKKSKDPRGYRVLEVINVQPAVTYLKRIT